MKINNSSLPPVSIIVPMHNSETTVLQTLESLLKQKYPIEKIIVVDNASADSGVEKVKEFEKKSKIPILVIARKKNKGLAASYNEGVKISKSKLVIFMHSDGLLPSDGELQKLTKPHLQDSNITASYSYCILPSQIWNKYNFWQKRHMISSVDKKSPVMCGKFDCVRRDVFLKIGGFNESINNGGFGGEDADLYLRLKKEGKVLLSEAKVIHLHYLSNDYSLSNWIKNRKLIARTYGRLLRFKGMSLPISTKGKGLVIPLGFIFFTVKPILSILPFVPRFHLFGIILLFVYVFLNSPRMYLTRSTLFNPRIILLPFIDIFLLYYETFWISEAFLLPKRKV